MIDAPGFISPGVLMGVELHHRQRPVPRHMGFQQRPGDEVIAPERQQKGTAVEKRVGLPLDGSRRGGMIAVVEQAIAVVDHSHLGEQVAGERILWIVVKDRRSSPDRLRPEAGAGAIGGGRIEGDAPDDGISARRVLAETPAHEGKGAGEGRVAGGRGGGGCGESMVDGFIGQAGVLRIQFVFEPRSFSRSSANK